MPGGGDQESTEKATPQRREKAKQKGQVAQTRELSTLLILLSALTVFFAAGSWVFMRLHGLMRGIFQGVVSRPVELVSLGSILVDAAKETYLILSPFLFVIMLSGVAANVLQKGFMFNMELLSIKLSRLNPVSGAKRMVSMKSFGELLKGILKLSFIGGVAFLTVRGEMDTVPGLMNMDSLPIFYFIARVAAKIIIFACLALLFLTFMDYLFQHWQHEKELKMTKQEIKDETKQREGDPLVKARIRRIQMEMARRRMMDAVPKADVVVTNPTRLAVALRYASDRMAAPVVVAKGANFIAARIREIASAGGVPIVENKPLAQALFASVKIGEAIPVALYKAVAEVLAYVYRLKGIQARR